MNKIISVFSLLTVLTVLYSPVNAAEISKSGISGKSVLAGVLSLIIWPGIGQAVNDEPGKKVLTHGIIGLLPPPSDSGLVMTHW